MRYSIQSRANDDLQNVLTRIVRAGYTVGQAKFIYRELNDLQRDGDIRVLLSSHDDHLLREYLVALAERFPAMERMQHDVYVDAVRVEIRAALHALGDYPSFIATRLIDAGIMGIKSSACACPIAQYLHVMFEAWCVSVSGDVIHVDGVEIQTPDVISTFIVKFDGGLMEELVSADIDSLS